GRQPPREGGAALPRRTRGLAHERDRSDDARTPAECRLDAKITADRRETVPHVRQSGAEGRSCRIKTRAIIGHLEQERILIFVEPDRCPGSLARMLAHILKRLEAA